MKEFEKWYNELSMREDAIDFTIPTYENYKKGWKVALEWVLREIEKHGINHEFVMLLEEELGKR